jgi:hypothetical protein
MGEMSLLDRHPRSATCKADQETVALVTSHKDFSALIDGVPGLSRNCSSPGDGPAQHADPRFWNIRIPSHAPASPR